MDNSQNFMPQAIEASIKIGALFLLLSWCYRILEPFIAPIIWAAIIAVAMAPVREWLEQRLGGKRKLASTLLTLAMLAVLIVPTVLISNKMFDNLQDVAGQIDRNEYRVEPPADKVKEWPVVGEKAHQVWSEAATNLDKTLDKYEPQIKEGLTSVLKKAAGVGGSILLFIFSVIISGFFLAGGDSGRDFLRQFARRMAGDAGDRFVGLAGVTIRNVTRGIIGVAIIQALLASIGLFVMDIPAAPLLTLGVLVLGIVQISPGLILIPVSIYAFSVAGPVAASVFLVWNIVVGALDNVLKPLLMGKGAEVPTLVIFLGAIGGFLVSGLVGLFVGAVILVLGYELFMAWLSESSSQESVDG